MWKEKVKEGKNEAVKLIPAVENYYILHFFFSKAARGPKLKNILL